MKTFAIINATGGVGKTTTAYMLCSALTILGYKVAGVDLDPQMTFTELADVNLSPETCTVTDLLFNNNRALAEQAQPTAAGFSIVPGNHKLYDMAPDQLDFTSIIQQLSSDPFGYDFCVIDTPPTSAIVHAVLKVADSVIIPFDISLSALHSLPALADTIKVIQSNSNPKLTVDGLLLTKYPYQSLDETQITALRDLACLFRSKVYNAFIPDDLSIVEAAINKKNLLTDFASSIAATGYMAFAHEVVLR